MSRTTWKFETRQVHSGQESADPATGARAVPIYQSVAHVFESCQQAEDLFALKARGHIYGRISNPTQDAFETRIADLEGGLGALALASGSAAIAYSILTVASQGDHIVAEKNIYGGSFNLLSQTLTDFGITATFVDADDLEGFAAAIRPNTKAIFAETIGNPNSVLIDMDHLAKIAHEAGIPLIVDNTFGTPFLYRPIEHGADIVVHSATKFIGGHGAALGGVIVDGGTFDWVGSGKFPTLSEPNPSYHGLSFVETAGKRAFIAKARSILLRDAGAALAPFHAFLFLLGLETLSLRVERHVSNTLKIVDYLANHPKVIRVNYPKYASPNQRRIYERDFPNGAGSIFTFDIQGGRERAFKFIDGLEIFSLLANVADVKSLVIHPATTTHSQLSAAELAEQRVTDGTIRLSIGIEHVDDLIADLDQAFAKV